jgi:uncharacterized membrane protein YciS (DUF1049 family)
MLKTILIIGLVMAVLIGGLLTLRSSARSGMPDAETLKRAANREREQETKDSADKDR